MKKKIWMLAALLPLLFACQKNEEEAWTPLQPELPDYSGLFGATSPSVNKDFEEDWPSQTEIEVVSSVYYENNNPIVRKKIVPLPWNFGGIGVQQHMPDDELRKMMVHQDHWALAFNTTGIETAAGANLNYFGLFNRYTHTLRVFYYWPEELIPASGANDHCWHVNFVGGPTEYNPTPFAVPLNHSLDGATSAKFRSFAKTYYTTALTDEIGKDNEGIVVPAPGWWAFDMDMSAMREKSFFDDYDEYSKMTIGLDVFDVQSVILESVFNNVAISGGLTGSMNLDGLIPQTANHAGKIIPSITGPVAGFLSNTYLLTIFNSQSQFGPWSFLPVGIGAALNLVGDFTKAYCTEAKGVDDPEKARKELGDLDATLDLTLSGSLSTTGEIKAQRSHSVPSLSLPLSYFKGIRAKKDFQMGKGIWNIENDPVVYVVKDALWANKPVLTYYSRKQQSWYRMGNDVAEYDLSSSPQQLGLRVISFFDPTSLGDVILNEDTFGTISEVSVAASYGVYPSGVAGNTDAFRDAVGLNYEPMTLATSNKDQRASTGGVAGTTALPFKIFKDVCTKDFFKLQMEDEAWESVKDLIGSRLSAQQVNDGYERRYYGTSLYFSNPDASASDVDIVQYVSDPQIFVPFNEKKRVITDPDLPDMVVSVQLRVESQADGQDEPSVKIYRLRYLPKIVYVNAEDVPALYEQMAAKVNGGMSSGVSYKTLQQHLSLVKGYADEIEAQLNK